MQVRTIHGKAGISGGGTGGLKRDIRSDIFVVPISGGEGRNRFGGEDVGFGKGITEKTINSGKN